MGEEDEISKEADEEKKELESEEKTGGSTKEAGESKAEPAPQEIILKVYMHCEGCATKVRRCLKGFEGVEFVSTDCRTSKVVVRGEKADPLKVFERIKNKSHRQVDLISPIPKKPQEKEAAMNIKSEEKIEEPPHVITAVLGVYMHCEACAQEIKKRILRMKGVESAEPDLKKSQVTVKGVFEPETLVEYVHMRTGKHAAIVATEAEKGKGGGGEQEKKVEEGGKNGQTKKAEENKENGEPPSGPADSSGLDMKRGESYYHYSAQNHGFDHRRLVPEWAAAIEYPPQMFSDENPNACAVM